MLSSPNFALAEVQRASASLDPAQLAAIAPNVARTLDRLERVRAALGNRAVTVTSLARSPGRNELVGGVSHSDHLSGLAADIQVAGLSPKQVTDILAPQVRALGLDQVIQGGTYVHIGAGHRERGQVLIAVGGGRYIPWALGQAAPITITAERPAHDETPATALRELGPLGAFLAIVVALIYSLTKGN